MTAAEPYFDMHSHTQSEIEFYNRLSLPGSQFMNNTQTRTFTIEGPLTERMQRDAVSPEHGVKSHFQGYFSPQDMHIEYTKTRPGIPDRYRITLTGSAYERMSAAEAASAEFDHSGVKPLYLRTVMLANAYNCIVRPDYTISEEGETAVIHGPISHRTGQKMDAYLAERFGKDGLDVTFSPAEDPQHFTAHLTGAAYTAFKTAQAAHQAIKTTAIGH